MTRTSVLQWLGERWVTMAGGLAMALPFVAPELARWFEYDRSRAGELWRWLACHFAHFGANHLFWSGAVFVILAAWLEPLGRRRLLATIALAALAIPVALDLLAPDLQVYRGLSGIDSALFMLALVTFAKSAAAERRRTAAAISAVLGLGLVAKLIYELQSGAALFADSSAFVAVPLAHAVGAVVGTIVGSSVAGPRPSPVPTPRVGRLQPRSR